jgi:hypothetical protein
MCDEAALTPITARELAQMVDALRRARRGLAVRRAGEVVALLDEVVDAWLVPDSFWFERAAALLPAATGFSPEMVRCALPTMLEPLRAPALADLLAEEGGTWRGPECILHVLAGNLPGLAAIPAVLSLAIGSSALLKAGRGDRVVPALFAASIAERDADLGACIAAAYWPGGERACEEVALAAADLIVASGDDDTIADLSARARGRFLGYGHRVSFAVIAREVADGDDAARRAAERLAEDIAIWDQRGCLSPQLCFVEGSFDTAVQFGGLVAEALGALAPRLPPARPSPADRLALRRFRDAAEWSGLGGERAVLFALEDEAHGTVVIEPQAVFRPTPLCRSLRVQPIDDISALGKALAPVRRVLEGAGLAAAAERWPALAEFLAACGVHRVCGLGDMQRPPLHWRQGGLPRVGSWMVEARS